MLSPQQYGFCIKHCSELAITAIYHDMICNECNKLITCLFLEFSKAFDCVDNNVFFQKLYF